MKYMMQRAYLVSFLWCLALPLAAQEESSPAAESANPSITVDGVGEVKVPAQFLETRGILMGMGETAADALQEYDRAEALLEKLLAQPGSQGITKELEGGGVSTCEEASFKQAVQYSQEAMRPMPSRSRAWSFVTIRVPIAGMDAKQVRQVLVQLNELHSEANLKTSATLNFPYLPNVELPPNWREAFSFTAELEPFYSQALEKAVADAERKAGMRAKLMGCNLGKMISMKTLTGDSELRVTGFKHELSHQVVVKVCFACTQGAGDGKPGEKVDKAAGTQ